MNIERFDVFENEVEIYDMIEKLQAQSIEHMAVPDDLWHTKTPKTISNTNKKIALTV